MLPAELSRHIDRAGMRRAGSSWLTRCPAHDDRAPSLSVSIGRDGRILLNCHAGCSLEALLDALGLTVKDLFSRGDTDWRDELFARPVFASGKHDRKPDQYLDQVYRRLIGLLTLSRAHREHLLGRGMTSSMIVRGLYRTLPVRRRGVVEHLAREFDLSGVPGFGLKSSRWVMTGSPGILLPVVSAEQKFVVVQVRMDSDQDGLSFKHLFSSWLEKGASSGARVHVAIPRVMCRSEVWITEGVLKADIAAHVLGAVVWSVPGVSNWREVVENWCCLPWHVVVAYDNDKKRKTKKAVRGHAYRLADALRQKSIAVHFAVWRNEKGLDDALLAGERIRLWPSWKK